MKLESHCTAGVTLVGSKEPLAAPGTAGCRPLV